MREKVSGLLLLVALSSARGGPASIEGCSAVNLFPEMLCQLTGKFDSPDWSCHITTVVVCGQDRYLGIHSVCQNIQDPQGTVYKCLAGQWIVTEPVVRKAKHREKRWWRRGGGNPAPPPPNQPPYFSYCPPDTTYTASSGSASAIVTWSTPSAVDPDGGGPSVTHIEGPSSGSSFQEGSTFIRYRAQDSGGLTAECVFTVKVTVTTCPDTSIGSFLHGTQSCSGARSNIYGSVCSHSCDAGYELNGYATVECQSDGQWSAAFPTCNPVSCGQPGSLASGQVVCSSSYLYLSTCYLQCNSGYQVTNPASISCQANGAWTTAGACHDVEPPKLSCPADQQLYTGPLEAPVTVTWNDPVTTDNSGQNVALTSSPAKSSSLGKGLHTVRITAIDASGNQETCEFHVRIQVRQCQTLAAPANGFVSCTHNSVEGSTCTIACNLGYDLQGQATLTCLQSEQWDSVLPQCNIVVCPVPSNPDHGHFDCPSGYTFASVCKPRCQKGYTVNGEANIQCLETAAWTPSARCSDVEPPEFTNGCPGDLKVYASPLGEDTVVHWDAPHVTDTSDEPVTLTSDVTSGKPFLPGETVVTYTATDTTGNQESCQFSVTVTVLTCEAPEHEISSIPATAMTLACPDGYVQGAMCTVSCTQGYRLMGQDVIWCERDNNTYPPSTYWSWTGTSVNRPQCKEDNCPPLDPPDNGALSCYLGNKGWDCLMSCHGLWDVPAMTDGHFYCTNRNGFWTPSVVPNCVARTGPTRVRLHTDLFYTTNSCNISLAELRENFITRLKSSLFKDACAKVPDCVAVNVEVTCGPLVNRVKRGTKRDGSDEGVFFSNSGSDSTQVVKLTFHIGVPYYESSGHLTLEETHQIFLTKREHVQRAMERHAMVGQSDVDDLLVDEFSLNDGPVTVECPTGTLFRGGDITSFFSCAGCGAGHYLPDGSTQCEACPVGSYTELDNATSCTPCPLGWSTPTNGSQRVSGCTTALSTGSVN